MVVHRSCISPRRHDGHAIAICYISGVNSKQPRVLTSCGALYGMNLPSGGDGRMEDPLDEGVPALSGDYVIT